MILYDGINTSRIAFIFVNAVKKLIANCALITFRNKAIKDRDSDEWVVVLKKYLYVR